MGRSVGIVAIDPTSPFSHGALLGDRIRMQDLTSDPEVFIRSMATRGALGGLAAATNDIVAVLDASGKDMVIVETVGAGQDEVDIADTAHTSIVISIPGAGDDMQAIKAGILEIADILVVNKADLPAAESVYKQLHIFMDLARHEGWEVPIIKTVSSKGEGITKLLEAIDSHRAIPPDIRPPRRDAPQARSPPAPRRRSGRTSLKAPCRSRIQRPPRQAHRGDRGPRARPPHRRRPANR